MGAKLDNAGFLLKAKGVHGERYLYDQTVYKSYRSKITVGCKVHGYFVTRAGQHLKGVNCQKCVAAAAGLKNRVGGSGLLDRLNSRSPWDTYTYTGINQGLKNTDKLSCSCPLHGEFSTRLADLLKDSICPTCAWEKTLTPPSEWLARFRKVHGDRYDYPNLGFGNTSSKINITCKDHGSFLKSRGQHVAGSGCQKCWAGLRGESHRIPFPEFLDRSAIAHGNTYSYVTSTYSKITEKIDIVCKKHEVFSQLCTDHTAGAGCPKCASTGPSAGQVEVEAFVKSLGVETTANFRYGKTHKREIDVFVPSRSFGVEYHGVYFHSSKFTSSSSHKRKFQDLLALGLNVLHVFSDEWEYKRPQVEQVIRSRLGLLQSVGARKCLMSQVSVSEARSFYNLYHIQGAPIGGVHLGLSFQGSLVAVMTFSQSFSARGLKTSPGVWELSRFASGAFRVVGGASKLLKGLVSLTGAVRLVSYSDNRFFSGNLYTVLGFTKTKQLQPSYTYIKPGHGKRLNKSRFQKKYLPKLLGRPLNVGETEKEACASLGIHQVYDCGLVRWDRVL